MMARWINPRKVPWIGPREPSIMRVEPPGTVSMAGRMRVLAAT